MPTLYLMDSICKNIGGLYVQLFSQHLLQMFSAVWFTASDETTREQLRHLVGTWVGLFPAELLDQIEAQLMAPLLHPVFRAMPCPIHGLQSAVPLTLAF